MHPSCQGSLRCDKSREGPLDIALKTPEGDKEETQQVTASLGAANGVSRNDAVVAVLSKMKGISAIKESQKTTLMAFLDEKDVFALLLTRV